MSEVREVSTGGGGGLGTGMIVGILLVLVVLAVAAFMFFGAFRLSAAPAQPSNPTNIQVNPPAVPPRIDVNVNLPQAPAGQAPSTP